MIRVGADEASLRDHVAQCEACRETVAVAEWMQRLAALQAEPRRLPDPGMLWWKAQLLQRWDAQRRASAPLETGQRIDVAIGVAGCAVLLAWLWPRVQSWSAQVVASEATVWASLAPGVLMASIVIGGLIAAATAIVAIRGMIED